MTALFSSIRFPLSVLIAVLGTAFAFGPSAAQSNPNKTLLLHVNTTESGELRRGLFAYDDYGGSILSVLPEGISVLATRAEHDVLVERGYDVEVVAEDTVELNLIKRSLYGPSLELSPVYHTYERILAIGDSLVDAHPDRIRRRKIGQTTQEGRDIFAFTIANDVSGELDRPAILLNGCHHADEIMGAQITTAAMKMLVGGYGVDPDVTRWLDVYEIHVVPVVNVDGHTVVTHGIDPRWRKNTRDLDGDGVLYEYGEGVDLNRNYDFNWARGGSPDSTNGRYRGEHPFSESENRAMRSLAEERRFLLSLTYHSQGEVIYYPWSWNGRPAPDDKLLTDIATGLAAGIRTMAGDTTYRAEYGAGTVGQSYPWLYGRYGTFDFVVETGRGSHVFPPKYEPVIVGANLEGIRYILNRAEGPGMALRVTDENANPLHATVWIPAIDTEDVDRRQTRATGSLWRLLEPGDYTIHVTADGFERRIIDLTTSDSVWTERTIVLDSAKN